jgi:GT2 family glycosyltransferase/polysaccharide pyruvyl transferase WcaK-like protein
VKDPRYCSFKKASLQIISMVESSIIIPVFNQCVFTRQCLAALCASSEKELSVESAEIIVVDDGSTDETPQVLREFAESVRVVTLKSNQGFASACNAGAEAASGKFLLFLNNDTLPQPGWLSALVCYAKAHPQAAAVGARLLFPDGSIQHAGVIIGQDRNPWHIYSGFPHDHPAVMKSRQFQTVTGACLLTPREVFADVGGFDTAFRNGFEDVDLCLRLGERGWEIHYCHESVLIHFEAQTRGEWSEDAARNHALYRERWAHQVRPDDVDYYMADDLLSIHYLYPHHLRIDPALGKISSVAGKSAVSENDESPDASLSSLSSLFWRRKKTQKLLQENIQLRSLLRSGKEPSANPAAQSEIRRIGICGTFDVDNYGDLLFPLIAEAELSRRPGTIELERFSYHEKTADEWIYPVISLTDLPRRLSELDGLIIGGGHLIRFDETVAPDYLPPSSDIHHPTGYWLTPALLALHARKPVVWNAPGASDDVPGWAEAVLRCVLSSSRYISVRDGTSYQVLSDFIAPNQINVVPDTAFGIARLVNAEKFSPAFEQLRARLGLQNPYLVVQANTLSQSFLELIKIHSEIFRAYQIVLVPIGAVLGDDVCVMQTGDLTDIRVVMCQRSLPPLLLAELIAHAEAVAGVSLHLGITATAFGVPVFRPTQYWNDKYQVLKQFETTRNYAAAQEISAEEIRARLGKKKLSPKLKAMEAQLHEHWDLMAAAFRFGSEEHSISSAADTEMLRFLQSLPGLLSARALLPEEEMAKRQVADNAAAKTLSPELKMTLDSLQSKLTYREAQLRQIQHSASWKLTFPLRAFLRKLRGSQSLKDDLC